jgi:hypothetical protein
MSDKLDKLKSLLQVANDGLSKEEFLDSFKEVVNQIFKLETKLIEKIDFKTQAEKEKLDDLKQEFESVISEAKLESDNSLSGFKRKTIELVNNLFAKSRVNQKLEEILNTANLKLQEFDNKIVSVRDGIDGAPGKDGQDAIVDEEKIVKEVLDKIDLTELEEMIEELRKELEELKSRPVGRLGGGGGLSKIALESKFIDNEVVGTGDGVITAFTLDYLPNPSTSLRVTVGSGELFLTDDWTLSGITLTFLTAPPDGAKIRASYRK